MSSDNDSTTLLRPEPAMSDVDISSRAFWGQNARGRDHNFAELRRTDPVSFHRPPELGVSIPAWGFWAVVRHADIGFVSRNHKLFCSSEGMTLDDIPGHEMEAVGSFTVMDPPRHTHLRRLVTTAFTPRRVAALEEKIFANARALVQDAVSDRSCDIVPQIGIPLPLQTISDIMGVSADHAATVTEAGEIIGGGMMSDDPDLIPEGETGETMMAKAAGQLAGLAHEMIADRRAHPRDDVMTALVEAEVDGVRLTDDEIASFFILLTVAGSDTTRHTIAHGIHAFGTHPDQWALLRRGGETLLATAAEETLRWATPLMHTRRTATRDTEIAGRRIREGDRVVMFYSSGNRDESVFDDPWRFDITRSPNPHIAFGGHGIHYCLGSSLAKAQLRGVLSGLASRVESFETGEPTLVASTYMHIVKSLPCDFRLTA